MRYIVFLLSFIWQIKTQNVFLKSEYPLTYLNVFHIKTKPFYAKRFIFDNNDSLGIEETKRRLRGLGVFREVKTERRKDTIFLSLHDAFTLSVFLDYKFYDTLREISMGLEEDNFLGTLTKASLYYFKKYERDYVQGGFSIPAFPLKTTDLEFRFERGKHLRKDMVMLNPFITPFISRYVNFLYIRQKKYEYLYKEGIVFDTTLVDYFLWSLKVGNAIRSKYTFVPYLATEYLKTKDTTFPRIGAGIYYVKLSSLKTRFMRTSLYNDFLTKGIVTRIELYPLLPHNKRVSLYLNLKEGNSKIYFDGMLIYSLSEGSGYARLKNKLYIRLPWRFTFFGYADFGIIHQVLSPLSYENILVFSLGADNGLYAYVPHYFNGREMALLYGEVRLFGPSIKKLIGFSGSIFYALGDADEEIKHLNPSYGFSLRGEPGIFGTHSIYSLNFGFKKLGEFPLISFGTTLDFQ